MNYHPTKTKRPRMMPPKATAPIRCPGHRADVRKYPCCVAGRLPDPVRQCQGPIEAHHTTTRGAGGGDETCAPICHFHHMLLDSPGWSQKRMEMLAGISFAAVAAHHASISEPLKRYFAKKMKDAGG